jgi:hypothetical protein
LEGYWAGRATALPSNKGTGSKEQAFLLTEKFAFIETPNIKSQKTNK